MNRTSITQRLTMLAAVPLIALAVSAGILIHDSYGRYRNAGQAQALMAAAVSAGNLIHALQIERGASAGFLQSKGARFADVLPKYRSARMRGCRPSANARRRCRWAPCTI
jgi:hypothetical protein